MNYYINSKNNSLLVSTKKQPSYYDAGSNSANFANIAVWNGVPNVTTVGTNGGPSVYGSYDQAGNVMEWMEDIFVSSSISYRRTRGGSYQTNSTLLSSLYASTYHLPTRTAGDLGFRVFSESNIYNFINFLPVGDVGNSANTTDLLGAINYSYYISKFLLTNSNYIEFLNAIAQTDANGAYVSSMGSDIRGGISRSGSSGSYSYTAKTNMINKPVNFLSWYNAARYCNWLHNNKPSGPQNSSTTENGAYTLTGNTGNPSRNSGAKYFIPTHNEWYKAAYYKGGSTNAGYWPYATQSNLAPTPVYATSVGDGIIPTIVLGNLNNNYSKTSTTLVSVSNAALGFNTNNDSKLKVFAIILRSPTLPSSVNIYSNSGGVPGSILFSSSGYASLGNGYNRYYFNNATLSSSSIYWVLPGVNWGLTTENGNLSNINNTPIAMNNSSYSFVDILQQVSGVWSSYSIPNSYVRNLTFSLECY